MPLPPSAVAFSVAEKIFTFPENPTGRIKKMKPNF